MAMPAAGGGRRAGAGVRRRIRIRTVFELVFILVSL
jgi:hypothetical protein